METTSLIELVGSEKQIAWAEKIRADFIRRIELGRVISEFQSRIKQVRRDVDAREKIETEWSEWEKTFSDVDRSFLLKSIENEVYDLTPEMLDEMRHQAMAVTNAGWWIENRGDGFVGKSTYLLKMYDALTQPD